VSVPSAHTGPPAQLERADPPEKKEGQGCSNHAGECGKEWTPESSRLVLFVSAILHSNRRLTLIGMSEKQGSGKHLIFSPSQYQRESKFTFIPDHQPNARHTIAQHSPWQLQEKAGGERSVTARTTTRGTHYPTSGLYLLRQSPF